MRGHTRVRGARAGTAPRRAGHQWGHNRMAWKHIARLLPVLPLALLLAGCPDSEEDTEADGDTEGEDPSDAVTMVSEATQLETGSTDRVTVSATLRDDDNLVITGEAVEFRGDGDIFLIPSEADEDEGGGTDLDGNVVTDASGTATIDVYAGANDLNNRTAEVIADSSVGASTIDLVINGTALEISGPGSVPIDQSVTYEVRLRDGTGENITGETVTLDASNGLTIEDDGASDNSIEKTTDGNGRVEVTVSGVASDEDTGTISASTPDLASAGATHTVSIPPERISFASPDADALLGVDEDHEVTVLWEEGDSVKTNEDVRFSVSRGEIATADEQTTNGDGEASVEIRSDDGGPVRVEVTGTGTELETSRRFNYVGTEPDSIELEPNPTTIIPGGETTLRAKVVDDAGNPVANSDVSLEIAEDASEGAGLNRNTITTDTRGLATVGMTAGPTDTGGQNDVKVVAEVDDTTPVVEAHTLVTVTGDAFSISLGTGNEIEQPTTTTYRQPWTVFVTDSSGSAVPNQEVRINVKPIAYRKGSWFATEDAWITFGGITVEDAGGNQRVIGPGDNARLQEGEVIVGIASPIRCISSDLEPDDSLLDGVSFIDATTPVGVDRPTDVAADTTDAIVTDSNGRGDFNLNYQESEAPWVSVRIEATIQGDGFAQTERSNARDLAVLADDVNDTDTAPPGGDTDGAYGVEQDCSTND